MQEGGDSKGSKRFTLRMDDEINKILGDIDEKPKSEFVREAILHYASSATYRRRKMGLDTNISTKDSILLEKKEKGHPETPVRVLHKPAWQR